MRRISAALATVVLALAIAAPGAAAQASGRATVTACAGETATVAASLRSRTRADLVVRLDLVPLVGDRRRHTLRLRGKRSALVSHQFRELPAGVWWGYVTYAWKRGRRTLARGSVRTSAARVGRRRGRADCVLTIGRPIRDTTPPQVFVEPTDDAWRRGPLEVRFHAFDDFSGIRAVHYSLAGGPARSGRTFTIADQGAHTVDYFAEDVAGNRSAPARAVVRVDTGPPTTPSVTAPPSVTGDPTPTVAWTPSADSGSGVRGYAVAVRDTSGSIVAFQEVGADATSASVPIGLANGPYTAQVYALDGTQPEPWVATSEPRSFRVDSSAPRALATDPSDKATISIASAGLSPRIDFDRPLDPASVRRGDTVAFTRTSAGSDPDYTVACASPCTSLTIDPTSVATLAEGVYEIAWTGGLRAEDGTPVTAGSARFSVPLYEDRVDSGCAFSESSEWACGTSFADALPGRILGIESINRLTLGNRDATTSGSGRTATFASGEVIRATYTRRFRIHGSCNDSAEVAVLVGVSPEGVDSFPATAAAAPDSIELAMPSSGSHTLALRARLTPQTTSCGESGGASSTGLYVDDVVIARKP